MGPDVERQELMRVPMNRKRAPRLQQDHAMIASHLSGEDVATEHLEDLKVDEMWGVESLAVRKNAGCERGGGGTLEQHLERR